MTFAWTNYFLQHNEKCANTSVFARCCPNNTVNTVVFATKDWIFLFHVFFFDFAAVTHFAPIRFYKQTTLRTEAFTQSSFYAQILLHREVVHREAFTHRCLYTQRLLHKEVFTQRSLHTDALHKDAFARIKAHRRFYTQNLLHREAFVQNSFYIH